MEQYDKVIRRKHKSRIFKSKWDWIFYIGLLIIPITQVVIFYFVVNINSILLAFKQYDGASGQFMWSIETLKQMFTTLHTDKGMTFRLVNSVIMYVVSMVVVLPLSLLFSFYIYKKKPASKFFRTMLFLPSVVSPIVLSMLFGYFVDRAIPEIMLKWFGKEVDGLLAGLDTQFSTVIVYNALLGFGVQVLMYANAMSGINDSTVEAARLDGANSMQEFWHISLPSIFPTLTTFVVIGVAGLFTNQLNLLSFFNTSANVETQSIGYYLAAEILNASKVQGGVARYPLLSAFGLLSTAIAVPLTFLVKFLMERFGPRTD